jgi:ABC-type lipoprotein release transport system permease subunit
MGVRADTQFNVVEVTLQSLVGSYAEEFDRMAVLVPLNVFIDLFGNAGTHEIAVLYDDDKDLFTRREKLQSTLAEKGWQTDISVWNEQAVYYNQVVAYYQGFYRIVLAVAAVIVFFAVGITMSLSLFERMREFGILLSMGTRRRTLMINIFTEAFMAGITGLVTGAVIAFIAAWVINAAGGIAMPAPPGMATAIQVLIRFSPQGAALSLMTALLIPILAVIAPTRRITKRDIVTLLNG